MKDLKVLNFIPSAETKCGFNDGTLGVVEDTNDDSTDDDDKAVSDDDDSGGTDDNKAVSDDDLNSLVVSVLLNYQFILLYFCVFELPRK